jgi:peptidoglycan/xylan/chitin deacetylase (PgdA/CDA1 family)
MYRLDVPHGLMFHRFHESGTKPRSQGSLTEIEFDSILKYVDINRILSPQEWIYRVKNNRLKAGDLCITFDDGLKGQYDVALQVLDKYDLKAFWFIFSSVFNRGVDKNEIYNIFITSFYPSFDEFFHNFIVKSSIPHELFDNSDYQKFYKLMIRMFPFYSDSDIKFRFIRNYVLELVEYEGVMEELMHSAGTNISDISIDIWLNNDHLEQLNKHGHCIGLHSYSHPYMLSELDVNDQRSEYIQNYKHIIDVIHNDVECMSHPLNSYSSETINILEELGIICGFRSNMDIENNFNQTVLGNLELPREDSSTLKRLFVG